MHKTIKQFYVKRGKTSLVNSFHLIAVNLLKHVYKFSIIEVELRFYPPFFGFIPSKWQFIVVIYADTHTQSIPIIFRHSNFSERVQLIRMQFLFDRRHIC